jgi:hypothetical protein
MYSMKTLAGVRQTLYDPTGNKYSSKCPLHNVMECTTCSVACVCSLIPCMQQVEQAGRVQPLYQSGDLGTETVITIVLSCVILFGCAFVGVFAWFMRHYQDKVRYLHRVPICLSPFDKY